MVNLSFAYRIHSEAPSLQRMGAVPNTTKLRRIWLVMSGELYLVMWEPLFTVPYLGGQGCASMCAFSTI